MPLWDTTPLPAGWKPTKSNKVRLVPGWEKPGLDIRRVGAGQEDDGYDGGYPDESARYQSPEAPGIRSYALPPQPSWTYPAQSVSLPLPQGPAGLLPDPNAPAPSGATSDMPGWLQGAIQVLTPKGDTTPETNIPSTPPPDVYPDESSRDLSGQAPPSMWQQIQSAPNVQALGSHINKFWNHPADQSLPSRLMQDVQEAGWEIPTTAYRAALDTAAIAGSRGKYGSYEANPLNRNPMGKVLEYAPDIAAAGEGVMDLGRAVRSAPAVLNRIRQAGLGLPQAEQLLRARSRVAGLGMPLGADVDLAAQLRASTAMAKKGLKPVAGAVTAPGEVPAAAAAAPKRDRRIMTWQTKNAIDRAIKYAPKDVQEMWSTMFKGQKVGNIVEAPKPLREVEAQQLLQALQQHVVGTPAGIVAHAATIKDDQALAEGIKELAGVPEGQQLDLSKVNKRMVARVRKTGAEILKNVDTDVQEAMSRGMWRSMSGPNKVVQFVGGAGGALAGYEDPKHSDDMKWRIGEAVVYGSLGLLPGHVLYGGEARGWKPSAGLANRAVEWWRRSLFSPKTVVGVKGGTDVTNIPMSVLARGADAFRRGGVKDVWSEVLGKPVAGKGSGLVWGYMAGIPSGLRRAAMAENPWRGRSMWQEADRAARGGQENFADWVARTKAHIEQPSPGQFMNSFLSRQIESVSALFQEMHLSGESAANARAMAEQEAKYAKSVKPEDAVAWLKEQAANDDTVMLEVQDKFPQAVENGWDSPEMRDAAMNIRTDNLVKTWAQTNLRSPLAVADEWLLLGPLSKQAALGRAAHSGEAMSEEKQAWRGPEFRQQLQEQAQLLGKEEPVTAGFVGKAGAAMADFVQNKIALGKVPIGKFAQPFVVVTSNALDRIVDYIPGAGLLNHLNLYAPVGGRVTGAAGRYTGARVATSQMVGTALGAGALHLAKSIVDDVNGNGPSDQKKRTAWLAQGNKPWTYKSPLDGKWHPMEELAPPVEYTLRFMGAAADEYHYKTPIPEAILQNFGGTLMDHRFFPSWYSFAASISQDFGTPGVPGRGQNLMQEARTTGAGLQRSLLGPGASLASDINRKTQPDVYGKDVDFLTAMERQRESLTPGEYDLPPGRLSKSLQPLENPRQGAEGLAGSWAGTQPLTDPASLAMTQYGVDYRPSLPLIIKNQDGTYNKGWMTSAMLHDVNVLTGQKLNKALAAAEKDPAFKNVPGSGDLDTWHKTLINKLFDKAEKDAIWEQVDKLGRDNVIKMVQAEGGDAAVSAFKANDVEHKMQQVPEFANKDGSPYKPDQVRQMKMDLAKYAGKPAATLPPRITQIKQAQQNARLAKNRMLAGSPDFGDYERQHMRLKTLDGTSVSGEQAWQLFTSGKADVFKPADPKQRYTPAQQLDMMRFMRLYKSYPSNSAQKMAASIHYKQLAAAQARGNAQWLESIEAGGEGTAPELSAGPAPQSFDPGLPDV